MIKILLILFSSSLVIIGLTVLMQHLVSEKEIAIPNDTYLDYYPVDFVKLEQHQDVESKGRLFSRLSMAMISEPNFEAMTKPADENHSSQNTVIVSSNAVAPVSVSHKENYASYQENGIILTEGKPVSTFSIDVDTGSYSNLRRLLNMGSVPMRDSIRVEEMINYFAYGYPVPATVDVPFSISTELAPSPWNTGKHILRIGLKGYEVEERLPANLVFLIDVSGSMVQPNKLPLVKASLHLLVSQLGSDDIVSIVTYAGRAAVVLDATRIKDASLINDAIENLAAGGSTYGEGGLKAAYQIASANFMVDGINRVILATDGDFNVGMSDVQGMKEFISRQRKSGIGLTALGYGMGNYNDEMLEQLADAGNGNHAYIDNLNEARKVLVHQLTATLQTIAEDVKIQVEFNPGVVAEYRLIGYENRSLAREDFNNDKVDAGEIGVGHMVTALYELTLVGSANSSIDPLRYGRTVTHSRVDEVAMLKLRYKLPAQSQSRLISQVVMIGELVETASNDTMFAAAVAGFGQLLKGGKYIEADYQQILQSARESAGSNPARLEFVEMIELSMALQSALAGLSDNKPAPGKRLMSSLQ